MRCYEIFDHTADIGFVARGGSLAEAFGCAAEALWDVIAGDTERADRDRIGFEIESVDREGLLVGFLSRLLFLFETDLFLGTSATVQLVGETVLKAEVVGERLKEGTEISGYHVKGVSYHMMELIEAEEGQPARVRVILDV